MSNDKSFLAIRRGVSRTSILIGDFVIKIPNLKWGQYYALMGMMGILQERRIWKLSKNSIHLAPCYFVAPFGIFGVYRRFRILWKSRLPRQILDDFPAVGLDDNGDNFAIGKYGNFVCLDYGNSHVSYRGYKDDESIW